MFILDPATPTRAVCSATDLALAATSEFDLLRTLDAKLGRYDLAAAREDGMLARAAELGDEHEQRHLEQYRREHGDAVVEIPRPRFTHDDLLAAHHATLDALRAGAAVVYQGTFYDGRFAGFCDFLVRADIAAANGDATSGEASSAGYAVYDTKLSRHARVTALLQLAAYADQLENEGIPTTGTAHLVLGDGAVTTHQLADILPVYRQRRARLDHILAVHLAEDGPVLWGDPRYTVNVHSDLVAEDVRAARDPSLVAGLTSVQRARLMAAGTTTIDAIAALPDDARVPGVSLAALERLRAQAQAQLIEERTGTPYYLLHAPDALGELPEPSPGDVFFDFEGDPLWADGADPDWGLEYLFGLVEAPEEDLDAQHPGMDTTFVAFWAHDRAEEKQALIDFVDYVSKRRARYPDMHVYHYAPYEKTALRRLAGRHGVCENEIDDLLRANVLIDLYPIVRRALRVGKPSYSIKKLEPLYMGDHLRGGDVTTAGDSIVEYAHFTDLRARGDDAEAAAILDSIADYNRYDCDSTLHLRNWLLGHALDHGIALRAATEPLDPDDTLDDDTTSILEQSLLARSGDRPRDDARQAAAMLAAALNYHKRERKPFWWAHFDRLTAADADLADANDALLIEHATIITDWDKPTPRSSYCRYLHLRGDMPTGSGVREGADVHTLYAPPAPDTLNQPVPQGRAVGSAHLCTEEECDAAGIRYPSKGAVLRERAPRGAGPHDDLPVALAPTAPPATTSLEAAIATLAEECDDLWPDLPASAGLDILQRATPRTRSGRPPAPATGGDTATAITTTLLDLADSYLAVQGPPGTGKTYTGSRVIASLVNDHGWKVGVVAQSHSVVENMLDGIAEAGVPATQVIKAENRLGSELWTTVAKKALPGLIGDAHEGIVVGGTAWTFSNANQVPEQSLDLLVIDEAGQYSLANTLAVTASTRNLLLLGDPQQLPQVSQGTHPEPVDLSALGWILAGRATMPESHGYFLQTTFRMHPALCEAVSTLSYEGRLGSKAEVTTGRHLAGIAPGVAVHAIDHRGNATSSIEEAHAVRETIENLLGTAWKPARDQPARPLGESDLIVVAPYNAQVDLISVVLRDAGLSEVLVGTVDKFQGRQAAVAIVSMTASAVEDVPRGMGFLMSRNRLNVAISRGQWLAVIVRSQALTDYMPTTPDGLAELGAFLGLCAVATS
ncbi:TM0106 family RecB-like putative nuclease [Lolliginicoccus suaedae]|uniref:TM0106 family RecB-like putative nuclease n=1 Tax=Lolliginicoccus suaedae TaxID=2605429 RepID=UPI0011EC07DF|nr:bifunctional RecB family nuclease/DEAD/DEAH box helicase [Lolliginicoccus suaedae]